MAITVDLNPQSNVFEVCAAGSLKLGSETFSASRRGTVNTEDLIAGVGAYLRSAVVADLESRVNEEA